MTTSMKQDLIELLGKAGVIDDAATMEPFLQEERGILQGHSVLVICPANTEQVSQVVKYCATHSISITPQGGNTGTVAGAIGEDGILLSLRRMNRIIEIDPLNRTATVESGCVLANLQQAAADHDLLFPVSLGSEGSCQLGGILSTNAGGVNVLRYGNAGEQLLGLEVVMPDGQTWDGLRGLRKDNTGYDLKRLFCRAEGTLGIITRAVVKLYAAPKTTTTLMVACPNYGAALAVFGQMQNSFDSNLSAAELISDTAMGFVVKNIPATANPFANNPSSDNKGCYVLFELTSARIDKQLRDDAEALLEQALEQGLADDVVIAENQIQANKLWQLRESISASQKGEGGSIKHDIAVPVSKLAGFLAQAEAIICTENPDIRICAFGHIGDGNLHYNLSQPLTADRAEFLAQWNHFNRLIHDLAMKLGGSFSAEHGIGQRKIKDMEHYKQPLELELMSKIKAALDPQQLMNPGKVIRR
ncbi:MAG: FAD-binding oxidoreductase [Motiliproteus sp.]